MPGWTIQRGATTQTLEEWGMEACVLALRGDLRPSTFSFRIAAAFDSDLGFAEGTALTLRDPDNTVRWSGKVRDLPKRIGGVNEDQSFTCEDVIGDLDRRVMQQAFLLLISGEMGGSLLPKSVLFDDGDGGFLSTAATLQSVITYAIAVGISIQFGDADDMTANPQKIDVRGKTLLEVLRFCLRFCPDAMHRIDYSTTPPTIHFIRRSNATEVNVAVIETVDEFTCTPLHRQQASAVKIFYLYTATALGGIPRTAVAVDVWPEEATGSEENALVYVADLRTPTQPQQAQSQSQALTVRTIESDSFAWWENHFHWLADRSSGALSDDAVSTDDYPREIISGSTPDWTGSSGEVIVEATFNGIIDGREYVGKKLMVKVHATTLTTGTYTRDLRSGVSSILTPSPPPAGIAQQLHSALSVLHWKGAHVHVMDELTFDVLPADALNFTGTALSALTTCNAQVHSVVLDLDHATRTLEFGPPTWIRFEDLIDLLSMHREMMDGSSADERVGELDAMTARGVALGPMAQIMPTPDDFNNLHPFKVRRISGNDFRVEAGSFDGFGFVAQTVDVGSSFPRAILIAAKFTLSVYNEEFVYAAALDTSEGNAPVLYDAATPTSDVTSIHDGDEARCVIAIITEGHVVNQIATKNIVSTIDDDGSLTGTAVASFDK